MKIIKKILKIIIPQKIIENFFYLKLKNKKYFGFKKLDKKLLDYLNYKNGFYVELGAADGITQSNTRYFEKNLGWKGILIEPEINNFIKCKKNRSKNNFFFNKACVGFNYKQKILKMISVGLMTTSLDENINKINPKLHAYQGKKYLKSDEKIQEFACNVSTLNDILIKSKSPKIIDFISLDVEGLEIEVLNGINFDHYIFKYILVESRDNNEMIKFLEKKNYQLIKEFPPRDLLFKYIL
jgi:FkbM family methyltransferase